MRLIIDRIEEAIIVAELPNMKTVNLPIAVAPDAKEGDYLQISLIRKEKRKNSKLAREIAELEKELREKD